MLAHLKIDHETVNIDLNSKPKWFREVSPLAKVPVYENNGSFTPDSVDIINLLAKDNKFELSKILSQGEFNGFMEQIVSLWYKICYYKGTLKYLFKNTYAFFIKIYLLSARSKRLLKISRRWKVSECYLSARR